MIRFDFETYNNVFIELDCSKIENMLLLKSEIYGHEKNSWDRAFTRKIGLLEVAGGGKFKIINPPKELKIELLESFLKKEFYRLGSIEPIKFNCLVEIAYV